MRREKFCGIEATTDAIVGPINADTAKEFVMTYIGELVANGHAEWDTLENGDVQLRCHTGEIFLLAETTIVRIV